MQVCRYVCSTYAVSVQQIPVLLILTSFPLSYFVKKDGKNCGPKVGFYN